ncbi:Transposase (plasmid) [Borrelia nietonii YOR]|uniref:Transposase n=1 Tax=Borrelia nietonii YOR TaxID=1293576 RepID=A0ABN4C4P2_9SPIR|nr:Transposase [Borrelia nietonii YOR]
MQCLWQSKYQFKLSDEEWICGNCNVMYDRGVNAILILKDYYYKEIKTKVKTV